MKINIHSILRIISSLAEEKTPFFKFSFALWSFPKAISVTVIHGISL